MTEQQLQQKCFIWFWNTYPEERQMLFHADNNSANSLVGNQKKTLGVTKGVSDFVLILYGAIVFIEMKTMVGVMSEKQREFAGKIIGRGHQYIVCRDFETFKKIICSTIGKK